MVSSSSRPAATTAISSRSGASVSTSSSWIWPASRPRCRRRRPRQRRVERDRATRHLLNLGHRLNWPRPGDSEFLIDRAGTTGRLPCWPSTKPGSRPSTLLPLARFGAPRTELAEIVGQATARRATTRSTAIFAGEQPQLHRRHPRVELHRSADRPRRIRRLRAGRHARFARDRRWLRPRRSSAAPVPSSSSPGWGATSGRRNASSSATRLIVRGSGELRAVPAGRR